MKTSRFRTFDPAPSKPRWDAAEIERLRKIATDYYAAYLAIPAAQRNDSADLAVPNAHDLRQLLDLVDSVDGADTIPPAYRTSPSFICGVAVGSVRRSKVPAYMSRPRGAK